MKQSTSLGVSLTIAAFILIGALVYDNNNLTSKEDERGPKTPTMNFPQESGATAKRNEQVSLENSVIKEGIQYVSITAQGGYSPRSSYAKAEFPTKLIIKTNGTYDCSTALVIRSLNYRAMLPSTGETVIDVGTLHKGDILKGVCSMGMYSFVVTFD